MAFLYNNYNFKELKQYKDKIINVLPLQLHFYKKYMLIINLRQATHFKQSGTGATEDWGSCGKLINNCLEHPPEQV